MSPSKKKKGAEIENPAEKRWNAFMKVLDDKFASFEKRSLAQDKAITIIAKDQGNLKKILTNAMTPKKGKGGKKGRGLGLDITKVVTELLREIVKSGMNRNPLEGGLGSDAETFYKSFMNHTLEMNKIKEARERMRNKAYSREHELDDDVI